MNAKRRMCSIAVAVLTLGLLTVPASAGAATTRVADGLILLSDFQHAELYTVRPDGSHFRQLTHGAPQLPSFAPSWGPNGGHIVFVRNVNGHDRIYEMRADGTRLHKVGSDKPNYNDEAPAYFPAGRLIIFSRCHVPNESCVIATMRRDGSHLHQLTRERHDVTDFRPAASPDGRFVAFSRFFARGIVDQTWIMRRNGSHAHPAGAPRYQAYGPDWAPNGKRLLFSSNCCRLGGNVYTSDLAGSSVRKLTHTPWPYATLNGTYSPTGTRIVMGSNRRHKNRCCVDMFILPLRRGPARYVPLPINHIDQLDWAPRRG